MRNLAIALLAISALLTGGCSLYFLLGMGSDTFLLSLPGLFVALSCLMGIRAIVTKSP